MVPDEEVAALRSVFRDTLREGKGLLLYTGAAPKFADTFSDRVDLRATGDIAAGVRAALVRPDGYTAWVMVDPDDEPTAALRRWFGG
jgi:hypothetical protein